MARARAARMFATRGRASAGTRSGITRSRAPAVCGSGQGTRARRCVGAVVGEAVIGATEDESLRRDKGLRMKPRKRKPREAGLPLQT